ncbi:MAG: rod shape-determining protein MreD [Flavobacteriales bacterium]|jgi:rod shape-determining protein MreD|nr:rod shape-determining protein MreD [Flavobacteriales bacterium]|tara:strand:+ start:17832 stop:18332 length:501 start_codon:yes stop_codon:yes gene_type:complete
MTRDLIKYIIQIPVYTLIQILILNEILFLSYINPYLYIILIIVLPYKTPKWFLIIYAFFLGFSIDIFSGTLGMHSFASVLIAFCKNSIAKITIPHNIVEQGDELIMQKIGVKSFLTYTFLITLIHLSTLFFLEHLNLEFKMLFKILLSVITTTILISITQLFFFKK